MTRDAGLPERVQDFAALPKVELHLHLEGAAPAAFIRGLAAEKHEDISGIFAEYGGYSFRDFAHFLKVYEAATSVLRSPADYRRLLLAVAEQAAEEGVVYAELFLSPDFCGAGDLVAWRDYLAALEEAAAEAEAAMGITLRGIVTAVRHFGPDRAKRAALCAAETAGGLITGFGMGGEERVLSPGDFAWSFDCAREAGLGLTCHAGEWCGPAAIRDTLSALRPSRLGHGVRAIEDLALVDQLAEAGVHLELCPGSNIALGLYPDLARHPVSEFERRGVAFSISTDDPPFFRTSMTREYAALHRWLDWDEPQFRQIARQALDAAFCDTDTKKRITAKLEG